ncbi:alpha/beta hydrolase [Asticcacaulis sp.]|uniref:alpha/beta fold hydrolase n=1 Tax=Asticcacaulis sp. TaxID=1872648 RepID=UPI002CF90D8C|nr:alpha/beta hydrolase [Asticcacaulis sp.]HTM82927.1 alpha/beta hydrolase [Asticcacaulis sp.]
MNMAKSNGIELAYDCFGKADDAPLLLIAGLGTQMIRWTSAFCEDLADKGYRVIRFDNRDVGRSTHFDRSGTPDFAMIGQALMAGRRPEAPYTLCEMAKDTIGLMDALGIDGAHLVGRSMGGMIAQIVASEYPDRAFSLTSIMSSTGNPALPPPMADAMALMTTPAPDPAADEVGFLANRVTFARRIAGTGFPFDESACRELVLAELRRAYDPAGTARQIAAVAVTGDRRSRLATITVPTLVIHGSDDPLFLPACGLDTANSIPKADFMLIEGMGHDLPPPLFAAIIKAIDRNARHDLPDKHYPRVIKCPPVACSCFNWPVIPDISAILSLL